MAFMVVAIHTRFLSDLSEALSYVTVDGLFRISVPVFLLINGFYFYPVLQQGKQRRWLKRIFGLYLIWMLFYAYAWLDISENTVTAWLKVVHRMLFGYLHLWYVIGLFGAALFFLRLHRLPYWILWFSVIVTFFAGEWIVYARTYHLFYGSPLDRLLAFDWVHRNFLFLAYPFFTMGYLLRAQQLDRKVSKPFVVIAAILTGGLVLAEAFYNYTHPPADTLVTLFLFVPALFLLFIQMPFQAKSKTLALYASAIYFIHIFFIGLLKEHSTLSPTQLTLVVFVLSVIAGALIIRLHKRFGFLL